MSQLNQNSRFPVLQKFQKGAYVYNTLVLNPKTEALDYNIHLNLSEIKNPYALCQGKVGEKAWLTALKATLEQSIPYLTKKQSINLWNKIKPLECITQTSTRIQNWVQLYDNLIHENYPDLLNISNSLLYQREYPEDHPLALEFKAFAQLKLGAKKEAKYTLRNYPLKLIMDSRVLYNR